KACEMDQSYRSTISIYKSILEQFNPALENLVYLGNNYLRAFHALSEAADIYFTAIQKIGEQALQSSTSQILGEILIEMSDTQRHLNHDVDVVAQTFHVDLLQHMEKNTKLDMQFINDSRQRYEMEYRRRTANLDKCMSELWRMERTRDKNTRDMKENVRHLHSEMQAFASESQRAAELEEKRRYRFLAEKHQLLSNTFLQFYSRARGIIQTKAPLWKEQLEASRNPPSNLSQSLLSTPHSQGYPTGRLTPSHLEMPQRLLGDFGSAMTGRSTSTFSQEPAEMRPSPQPESIRRPMQRSPSAGKKLGAVGEGGGRIQAIVPHSTGTNRTLLHFSLGDIITVLIAEAQNGWLYGKLEGTSMTGWFPEAFVKLEVPHPCSRPSSLSISLHFLKACPTSLSSLPRSFPLRSSHSMDDLLDRPSAPSVSDYWLSTTRPQSPNPSPASLGMGSRRSSVASAATSDSKVSSLHSHCVFPHSRGTNPFATVKLRPTVTNDRSAPVIR
uniref:BAR/IMD domain containing adaptor protein 2 like 2 n=1 Tax=Sphenodon punctatus TaxID=8508 RepID=A0A8D0GZW0_SPHPU